MTDDLLYEVRDGAAWVTLNRPDALNAMNQNILDGYARVLDRAEGDPEVKAIVFTGTGRAFSAGADLKYVLSFMGEGDPVKVRTFMKQAYASFARVGECEKPTIAAVNGITAAGGMELLLACDLVIAAESVKIGDGHINFGMLPGGGSSIRLPRKIGETRARYLLMTGELLPVTEIADWGLVNEIVPDDQLIARTEALVARLTSKSPLAMRQMKHMIDQGLDMPLDRALQSEMHVWEAYGQSHDVVEGLTAFTEKRAPDYKGR
ncbi:enoyl-CoA hydratase/isomerase family protein [Minwuia sp.]|uniref:enoyl-CoA hydratase/isomerase family protein n=1 Tax=Minwuia sp. TaxID=2493630 RepID=UPI003A92BC0D